MTRDHNNNSITVNTLKETNINSDRQVGVLSSKEKIVTRNERERKITKVNEGNEGQQKR